MKTLLQAAALTILVAGPVFLLSGCGGNVEPLCLQGHEIIDQKYSDGTIIPMGDGSTIFVPGGTTQKRKWVCDKYNQRGQLPTLGGTER